MDHRVKPGGDERKKGVLAIAAALVCRLQVTAQARYIDRASGQEREEEGLVHRRLQNGYQESADGA